MHLGHFFPAPASPEVGAALAGLPPFPPELPALLVVGPARCGKSALLWALAHRLAAGGGAVLVVCARQKVEGAALVLPQGAPPGDPAWENVYIKYLQPGGADLLRFAASLHVDGSARYAAILVDDLGSLAEPRGGRGERGVGWGGRGGGHGADMALCGALAVLRDCADFVAARQGAPCAVVASEGAERARPLGWYQRWLPVVLQIHEEAGGTSDHQYRLAISVPHGHAFRPVEAHYVIRNGALALRALGPLQAVPHAVMF